MLSPQICRWPSPLPLPKLPEKPAGPSQLTPDGAQRSLPPFSREPNALSQVGTDSATF